MHFVINRSIPILLTTPILVVERRIDNPPPGGPRLQGKYGQTRRRKSRREDVMTGTMLRAAAGFAFASASVGMLAARAEPPKLPVPPVHQSALRRTICRSPVSLTNGC